MTEKQISMMFDKLWKVGKKNRFDAIKAVIMDDVRPSIAERKFNLPVNTLARDVKRVRDAIKFCESIVKAGEEKDL